MHETSKAMIRRLYHPGFQQWFAGEGLDVGAGDDPLGAWAAAFPLMESCRAWDKKDGDAQTLPGIQAGSLDFVHSSHCLEHLKNPEAALLRWWEVLRKGGRLVVVIPDEDLYEQGMWPSRFNPDHKHTFTLHKAGSWSSVSINVLDLVRKLPGAVPLLLHKLEHTMKEGVPRGVDQTLGVGEAAIEFVLRKG